MKRSFYVLGLAFAFGVFYQSFKGQVSDLSLLLIAMLLLGTVSLIAKKYL